MGLQDKGFLIGHPRLQEGSIFLKQPCLGNFGSGHFIELIESRIGMFGIVKGASHLDLVSKFSIKGFKHGMGHGSNDGGMNPMNLLYMHGHEFVY